MRTVYLLQSINHPDQTYVGVTEDLPTRLKQHNSGRSSHSSKFAPWRCVVSLVFEDDRRANAFERYLKTGSGRAFAERYFW
jgi:predicted GIY-YIG superfamily endonuclease